MECDECERLYDEFERLERDHASLLQKLYSESAKRDLAQYQALRDAVDRAAARATAARAELSKHELTHPKARGAGSTQKEEA